MLLPSSPVSRAHRAGATALALAFLLLAFAPVRLVAAREEAGKNPGRKDAGSRTEVAYLLKTKGQETTRGAIDHTDFDHARDLKLAEGDAIYFRLGERRWITTDAAVIAEVRRALAPEDRFDEQRLVFERRREPIERRNEALEQRFQDIEERKSALEERRMALEERREAALADGREPAREREQMEALRREYEVLRGDQEALYAAKRALAERLSAIFEEERGLHAEMERVHAGVMREIERIARRALSRGVLEPASY